MKSYENTRPGSVTTTVFADVDSDLRAAVTDAIERITTIPPENIQVTVKHGHVTLRGFVEGRNEKLTLEQIVRNVYGVTGVSSLITIHPGAAPALR